MNTRATSRWNADIQRRRTTLLDHLLLTTIGGGLLAMALLYVGMPEAMSTLERLTEIMPFFIGWVVILLTWLWRDLGYRIRALLLLALAFILGCVIFARGGLPGSGRVWLLLLPTMASVLLSPQAGIVAGAISTLTYIFFTLAINQGWVVPQVHEDLTALAPLLSEGGTFLFVAAILTLILWSFTRSWLEALAETSKVNQELQVRTQELEAANEQLHRHASQLQATTEIAHAGSSILDLQKLPAHLVDRIHERFGPMGVDYVGLFLIDETRQSAVLNAAAGQAGPSSPEVGHTLELDEDSIVSRCITRQQAQIALDTEESVVEPVGSLLPNTHSEIALPLSSRGRILGALSVQSPHVAAFDEADMAIFQTMADQVAVAIDNAVLFSQTQSALEELQAIQRRYLTQVWGEFLATEPMARIDYSQPGTEQGGEEFLSKARRAAVIHERTVATCSPPPDTDGETIASQAALVIPLKLRGQVIGTVALHRTDQPRPWTAEEITLAETVTEQAALTVENLRLMDETQRRAVREQLTRQITEKMRRATSVEGILHTAVDELASALGASRTFVRLGAAPSEQTVELRERNQT